MQQSGDIHFRAKKKKKKEKKKVVFIQTLDTDVVHIFKEEWIFFLFSPLEEGISLVSSVF